jgi:hypothetical protein
MCHPAVGKDGDLLSGGANQFDGTNSALGIVRWNVDNYYFRARILQLTEDGIGRSSGKSEMAEYGLPEARRFQTTLQRG